MLQHSYFAIEWTSPAALVDLIISLEGHASAEGWPGWWGLEGPEYLAWLEQEGRKATPSFSGRTHIGRYRALEYPGQSQSLPVAGLVDRFRLVTSALPLRLPGSTEPGGSRPSRPRNHSWTSEDAEDEESPDRKYVFNGCGS